MSRILKRPMFRKGGEVMEGIMTGIKPRQNYSLGQRVEDYKNVMRAATAGPSTGPDALTRFLLQTGEKLIGGESAGGTKLQEIVGSTKDPMQNYFASLDKKAQQEKSIGLQGAILGIKGQQAIDIARAKGINNLQKDYSGQRAYETEVSKRVESAGKLRSFDKPNIEQRYPRATADYDTFVLRRLRTTNNETGKMIAAGNMGFVPYDSKTGEFDYNKMQAGGFYFDPRIKSFVQRVPPVTDKDGTIIEEGGIFIYDKNTFAKRKLNQK